MNTIAVPRTAITTGVDQQSIVSPLYLCVSHGEDTALTSQDQAANHMVRVEGPINTKVVSSIKMKESDEAQWQSTQSGTTSVMAIKPFLSGTSAGATDVISWGTLITTFAVQFRTRSLVATALRRVQQKDEKKSVPLEKIPVLNDSWYDESEEMVVVPRSAVKKDGVQPARLIGSAKGAGNSINSAGAAAAAAK